MTKEERLKAAAEEAFNSCFDFKEVPLRDYSTKEITNDIKTALLMAANKGAEAEADSKWRSVLHDPPPFDEPVFVWCEIYGRYIATHVFLSELDGVKYGNWHNGKELGVLPPKKWQPLPSSPLKQQ